MGSFKKNLLLYSRNYGMLSLLSLIYLFTSFLKFSLKNTNQPQLQIANIDTDMCLDSAAKPDDMQGAVDPYKCHGQGGNQVLFI